MDDQSALMATIRENYEAIPDETSKTLAAVMKHRGPQFIHFDNWRSSGWDVFTHGGFLTYPHHDASGQLTFSYVRAGAKLWGYLALDGVDDSDQSSVIQGWSDYYKSPMASETYDKGVKIGTVLLERGGVL